uniref:Uncharacterized protein n=1 Tax=Micrurus paraensis TaxID=1970185 RepID=A0A2D4L1V2_9SAUR
MDYEQRKKIQFIFQKWLNRFKLSLTQHKRENVMNGLAVSESHRLIHYGHRLKAASRKNLLFLVLQNDYLKTFFYDLFSINYNLNLQNSSFSDHSKLQRC